MGETQVAKLTCSGRFSNGPTWPEQLANLLGVVHVDDRAYGGATLNNSFAQGYTGYNSDSTCRAAAELTAVPVPDVLHQVQAHIKREKGNLDPHALYIVSGGSNDAFFNLTNAQKAKPFAGRVLHSLWEAHGMLARHGAAHLLVPTLTSAQLSPYALEYAQPAVREQLAEYLRDFNAGLKRDVEAESSGHGWRTAVADLYKTEEYVVRHAARFNMTATRHACLTGTQKLEHRKRHECSDPHAYAYWDLYHPTAHLHALFAHTALEAVSR